MESESEALVGKLTRSDCEVGIGGGHSACFVSDPRGLRPVGSLIRRAGSSLDLASTWWLHAPVVLNDSASFRSSTRGWLARISPRVSTVARDVGFSASYWVRCCCMPHVGSLAEQVLRLRLQVGALLSGPDPVAHLLACVRSVRGGRMWLIPRDQLLAVEVICEPPVLLLFLAFSSILPAEGSLILMLAVLISHGFLALTMAFSSHQAPF